MALKVARVLTTVAALGRMQVCTEDGRRLGRVFDVRVRWDAKHTGTPARVTELLYGTSGLLEQLGIRRQRSRAIAWRDVIAIRDGKIIVRA